ncbi:MAG: DUF5678 domain-containing protein [Candidatus Magnetobacterium sp. LHC-1]|uniref:DUF5678 domain-containing protein n=1 Tax=Candidatus Magnetobacterium casense TaxID=1455061 RepID=A0ABS6RWX9_9BACT|nr:DUF5678 domain-containing protein [Candidatus Magnetobacterium casensis]MBF0606278.1 hypothetical protein [Nitrospirota bacterium]MBV6341130.1 hypothetical protein [Candidatus Magnetobacterium casensis]
MDTNPFCVINDAEKYAGKYVATRGFGDNDAIASGNTIREVYQQTENAGISDPVVFYVRKKGTTYLY